MKPIVSPEDERRALKGLVAFKGALEASGFNPGSWSSQPPGADGSKERPYHMPYFNLSKDLSELHRACYDLGWITPFDWMTWVGTSEAKKLIGSPKAIACASLVQLQKILTATFRAERFGDGHIESRAKDGTLLAVARRAEVLLAAMTPQTLAEQARKVANRAKTMGGKFRKSAINAEQPAYKSMGVLILDGILQAGMNYAKFVAPRVHQFCKSYPGNATVSDFLNAADKDGWEAVSGHHGFKLGYMKNLAEFLFAQGIETVADFKKWAAKPGNPEKLCGVKGVSQKTRDYVQMLAGAPVVAVDVQLKKFVKESGVFVAKPDSAAGYEEIKEIIIAASKIYGVTPFQLDQAIWLHGAQEKNPGAENLSAFAGMSGPCNPDVAAPPEYETVRVRLSAKQMAQLANAKVGDIVVTDEDGNFIVHKTH